MYGLIGKITALPGRREALIDILQEGIGGMPGCHGYVVARDPDEDDAIWITEVWDSMESHEASLSLPSVLDAISKGRPLIAGFSEQHVTEPVSRDPGFKPAGYNSVSPYLVVPSADKTIQFLGTVFGATVRRRFLTDDGRTTHAEVLIDDTVVMMGESGGDWHPIPAHVHVYVRDVDDTYTRALRAGGESVQEPVEKGDGDKRGGVKGPGGITWWISTQLDS